MACNRMLKYRIITNSYNLEISIKNTKIINFEGKCPVTLRTIMNDKIIEHVQNSNCLGCDVCIMQHVTEPCIPSSVYSLNQLVLSLRVHPVAFPWKFSFLSPPFNFSP
jgi:hypothetical protein